MLRLEAGEGDESVDNIIVLQSNNNDIEFVIQQQDCDENSNGSADDSLRC